MGIFIKNPQTEKAVREFAAMRGTSITGAIDALAREALERERSLGQGPVPDRAPAPTSDASPSTSPSSPPPRPGRKHSLDEMRAATREFRRKTGLDKQNFKPIGKSVWDALWPTGVREIDHS